jgi:hypothetical protein
MYLPGTIIYQDVTSLEWYDKIEEKYAVSGGTLYQANKADNGNYVFKYLGGVSLMQLPFFIVAHIIALNTDFPPDGFSAPYQYAIAYGAILYCILGLLILRNILLRYFTDKATAIGLFLLIAATNLPQYISIDGGMSHAYIFLLYPLVLYTTIKWHEQPKRLWASLTGLIIGIATICRPTEAIMFLIPLLWNTHTKADSSLKWEKVKLHKSHLINISVFGLLGILPQLIYWQMTSGSLIYNVGSKWLFFNPFFRVLFGWQNGWFIYTPIAILFIVGLFFTKNLPFKNAAIWFIILNIWIVISWSDWRYGSTYSTRALVQSSAILALPFVALIDKLLTFKWHTFLYPIFAFLIYVNFIQISHYNSRIIHSWDMNKAYFWSIYADPNPTPLDMSLLDTDEMIDNEQNYSKTVIGFSENTDISGPTKSASFVIDTTLNTVSKEEASWIKIDADILLSQGVFNSYLNCEVYGTDTIKYSRIRLYNETCTEGRINSYAFYVKVPVSIKSKRLKLYIASDQDMLGYAKQVRVQLLSTL